MIVQGKRPWHKLLLAPHVVLLAPAAILYTAFFVWPAAQALYVSLTDWSGFSPKMTFVGLQNFRELLYERDFWLAMRNNFIFMTCGGAAMFFFALLFAAALSSRRFRGRRFFKTVLFAPYVVSVVGVAILWTFVYDPNWGLLNGIITAAAAGVAHAWNALLAPVNFILAHVGAPALAAWHPGRAGVVWLGSPATSIPSIIAVMVWGGIGFYVVLFMAGIDRIPDDYYEAARIDGATETQAFFHITLPLLREVLVVAISMHIIGALKTFGLIWAMTQGSNGTQVMETFMYTVAFDPATSSFRMGYGTSMTVVLFLIVVAMTFTFNWIMRRSEVEF